MKKRVFKFTSFLLAAYIIIVNVFSCSIVAYAYSFDPDEHPFLKTAQDFLENVSTSLVYIVSSLGAVTDGNFANYVSGLDAWHDYWNKNHITVDEKSKTITFSDDLVKFIKQALKEYAGETNGFIILPSVHFSTLSTSTLKSSYQYQTLKAFVNEYGVVGVKISVGEIHIKEFSEYLNNNAGFYIRTSNGSSAYYVNYENYLSWSQISSSNYTVRMGSSCEKVIHSWEEAESSADSTDGLYYYTSTDGYSKYRDIIISKHGAFYTSGDLNIISKDGRNILVFKNKTALENYSVDHRSVYFGSKFYEDTGAVTGTYDDLKDWLDGKYDDFFDKLKELIPEGSNLSEDDLEKIVDKLLDGLDEIGDKIEDGNKETNNLLQQILNALNKLDATVASALSGITLDTSGIEAYLARILADLDYIVYEMEDKTEDEISDDLDNMSDTIMDTFSDLGDVAKTKFPLSIPWDIYNLLTMLGGGSPAPASDVLPESYDTTGFVSISTYSLEEINTYSGEHGGGGNDHGTGNEDGGGGHSRGGYYLSADGDPVFVLPLIFSESMGLGGTINIDMAQFRVLSDISRTLFTLIFAVNLINLTFKAVGLGKDVFE